MGPSRDRGDQRAGRQDTNCCHGELPLRMMMMISMMITMKMQRTVIVSGGPGMTLSVLVCTEFAWRWKSLELSIK